MPLSRRGNAASVARMMRLRPGQAIAALAAAAILTSLPACGGTPATDTGVRTAVLPDGRYRLRSVMGVEFTLPGRPRGRLSEIGNPSRPLRRERYELRLEGNSRGYLVDLVDARTQPMAVATIREQMLDSLVSENGRLLEERTVNQGGQPVIERVVESVTVNQHYLISRVFELDGIVVRATSIQTSETQRLPEVDAFFASFR